MHALQELFATAEGEKAFEERLHALFRAAAFDDAEALLAAELQTMDGEIARQCLTLPCEAVIVSGWEDLVATIEQHEGEPASGMTLAVANEADLAFEKGRIHEPYLMLGIYTDEAWPFSSATPEQLIAECGAEEGPGWAGREEDVEVYLQVEGLGALNTALLFHKQRHFFRDDNPAQAPMRYVDYVIGCWWRALRFQQAVAAEYARHGLPGGIPIVAGLVDMRPELVSVHSSGAATVPAVERRPELGGIAEISAADFIQRKPLEEEKELTGSELRRRFAGSAPEDRPDERRSGFLSRLFGRRKSAEAAP